MRRNKTGDGGRKSIPGGRNRGHGGLMVAKGTGVGWAYAATVSERTQPKLQEAMAFQLILED